jgi:hypothetical protein
MEKQGPRISYSTGTKIGDNKYGSFDVHISMSDDVRPGETEKDTLKRLQAFVEGHVNARIRAHKEMKDAEREDRKRRIQQDDEELDRQIEKKAKRRQVDDD